MPPYILQRVEDGKYVAPQGAPHSYVNNADQARTFATLADALANACGNERVWYWVPGHGYFIPKE